MYVSEAPQTAAVDDYWYRAFRTVQAALQTPTAVVSSPGLVGCRNGGNSVWVDTRGHVSPLCTFFRARLLRLSSRVFSAGSVRAFPSKDVRGQLFHPFDRQQRLP